MTPLLLFAGAAVAGYLISLRLWPIKACRRCEGSGKTRSPSGRNWRTCKRCRGSGGRVRIGRRVWDSLSRTTREATRDQTNP